MNYELNKVFDSIDFDKIIDHPNILIAAHFWEEEKYMAAKTCYKFMRAIDDLIDDYKSEHKTIALADKKHFEADEELDKYHSALMTMMRRAN